MKQWNSKNLWGAVVSFIAVVMLSSAVFMSLFSYLFFRLHIPHRPSPIIPMLTCALTILIVDGAVILFFGRRLLEPVREISRAAQKVAKGDFSVSLKTDCPIQELNDMSANFNTMVRELNSVETLRNDFVVNVSHEFKTPLSAISGYASLLLCPETPEPDRQEYARAIVESARQLSNLTGNILQLAKLENQSIPPATGAFSLDEQIRRVILLLEPQWAAKNLELDIDLDDAVSTGNEELLFQVWRNILENAVKFTPEGGKITVKLNKTETGAQVVVQDTGIGMDPSAAGHIFDKFYQCDTSHQTEGNGLGLALVKKILDLQGGSIQVQSVPGRGSVFLVNLPF